MNFLYRQIFQKALQIIWHNKFLLILGVFASFFNFYEFYNIFSSQEFSSSVVTQFISWSKYLSLTLTALLANNSVYDYILTGLFFLVGLAVFAFIIWLAVNSQVAIVYVAHNYYQKKNYSFHQALLKAKEKFLEVVGLNIFGKIAVFVLFIFLNLPLIALSLTFSPQVFLASSVFYVLLFVLVTILAALVYFTVIYAVIFVVLKNFSLKDALKKGFSLLQKNWLVVLEVALILVLLNILANVISYLLVLFILFLFVVLQGTASAAGIALLIASKFLLIVVAVLFMAAITVFNLVSWVVLFENLEENKITSKILKLYYFVTSKIFK